MGFLAGPQIRKELFQPKGTQHNLSYLVYCQSNWSLHWKKTQMKEIQTKPEQRSQASLRLSSRAGNCNSGDCVAGSKVAYTYRNKDHILKDLWGGLTSHHGSGLNYNRINYRQKTKQQASWFTIAQSRISWQRISRIISVLLNILLQMSYIHLWLG